MSAVKLQNPLQTIVQSRPIPLTSSLTRVDSSHAHGTVIVRGNLELREGTDYYYCITRISASFRATLSYATMRPRRDGISDEWDHHD